MLCYKYAIPSHNDEKQFELEYFLHPTLKIHSIVTIIGKETQITRNQCADVF